MLVHSSETTGRGIAPATKICIGSTIEHKSHERKVGACSGCNLGHPQVLRNLDRG